MAEEDVIGKEVKVFWEYENEWFEGIIEDYHPKRGYHIQYFDGEDEWLKSLDHNVEFIDHNVPKKIAESNNDSHGFDKRYDNSDEIDGGESERSSSIGNEEEEAPNNNEESDSSASSNNLGIIARRNDAKNEIVYSRPGKGIDSARSTGNSDPNKNITHETPIPDYNDDADDNIKLL